MHKVFGRPPCNRKSASKMIDMVTRALAETWEETMPATLYGIEKYLGSGLVKGVGRVEAAYLRIFCLASES